MTVTTALDDPSRQHLDRIVREIIADRLPADVAEVRLLVAADLGLVLDRAGVA